MGGITRSTAPRVAIGHLDSPGGFAATLVGGGGAAPETPGVAGQRLARPLRLPAGARWFSVVGVMQDCVGAAALYEAVQGDSGVATPLPGALPPGNTTGTQTTAGLRWRYSGERPAVQGCK